MSDTSLATGGWSDRLARLSDRLRDIAGSLGHADDPPRAAPPDDQPRPWEAAYAADVDWHIALAPDTMTGLFDRAVETYAEMELPSDPPA